MRNKMIVNWSGCVDSVVIFTPEELGLASVINGRKVEEYWISKYQNTIVNGIAYSSVHQRPAVSLTKEHARYFCQAKGDGWHLITNEEWNAIVKISNNPAGNTCFGCSIQDSSESGIKYAGSGGKVLTGSGPISWNHDRTRYGLADMCGNVHEFVDGTIIAGNKIVTLSTGSVLSGNYGDDNSVIRGGCAMSGEAGDISSICVLPANVKDDFYGFRSARVVFKDKMR